MQWSWRRSSVIARDWRRLEPVRAYAEALGIPIDMANETMPSLWRMRDMQGIVAPCWWIGKRLMTPSGNPGGVLRLGAVDLNVGPKVLLKPSALNRRATLPERSKSVKFS